MDDKELIKKIKNSYSAGLSKSEITRRLQKQNYKLEYIDILMNKASLNKLKIIFVVFIMIIILGALSYIFLFNSAVKLNIPNPLLGITGHAGSSNLESEVQITPDFITYLLNEIGAYKLHKNILTGEPAVINIDVDGRKFYSEVDKGIKTFEGGNESPDISITTSKQEIINAISGSPEQYLKNSIQNQETKISIFASTSELLAKGYISVYNTLKP